MKLKYPTPSSWIDNLWLCVAVVSVLAFCAMYIDRANEYYKGEAEKELPRIEREAYERARNERLGAEPPPPVKPVDDPPFVPHRRERPAYEDDTSLRKALAERLSDGPKKIDWTQYSLEELRHLELKKSVAEELAQRGILIDWETASLSRLEKALQQPAP